MVILTASPDVNSPPSGFMLDGSPARAAPATPSDRGLTLSDQLRREEFSGTPRAGFCLMGACQDCWVATADGRRLRACTTRLEPGMRLRTLLEEQS